MKPPSKATHGLIVLTPAEANQQGFQSITTDIHAVNEKPILAGVCQHRNPYRACLIAIRDSVYQLGILKTDVSNLAELSD